MPTSWGKARMVTMVPVRKMSRAIRFYTKHLGGKLNYRGRGEMRDAWASVRVGHEEFWLVVPEARERRKLAYQGFLVGNIEKAVAELQRRGVKFDRAVRSSPATRIQGPIAYEPFGAAAFFKDSEGNLLMLWANNPPM